MKLSTRLGVIVGCSVSGLLLVSAIALFSLNSSMNAERHAQIDNLLRMSVALLGSYNDQVTSGKLSREQAQAQAAQSLSGLRNGDAYLFARTDDDTLVVHVKKERVGKKDVGAKLPDGRTTVQAYRDALAAQGNYAFVEILTARPGSKDLLPKLNGVARFEPWGWTVGTGFYLDDIASAFRGYAISLLLAGLAILGITAAVAGVSARRIYGQLGGEPDYAAEVTRTIASGDLGQTISSAPRGSVLAGLAEMQGSLREMIRDISVQAEQIKDEAAGIHSAMEEISAASADSSEATSSTAAAVEQMVVSIGMIADGARETELNSSRAADLAKIGESQVSDAASEIWQVSTDIESASQQIAGLAERTRQIGGIASVIREIAEQTNLLALNAAIEAARAGEQGRGFAVVADEVRKLAERTSSATSEITSTIQAVQTDTGNVVASMQAVAPKVAKGVAKAEEAAHALHQISEGTDETLVKIRDVAHATSEQTAASNSIGANVERIASMLEEADKSVRSTRESVESLSDQAVRIHAALERFRV
ncbi:methyl-accepting chemotaxis protein [Niveibacterium terrae]|uniref:methyl-accepting chemotaxis protein n=1 Tax=Niveibacterium terrae TaxID=3373598 RepID=UPI003A91EC4E